MANNYCAVPHIYIEECEALSDAEFGRLMRALLRYSRDGEVMAFEGNERFFARRMMTQEDVFNKHYEQARARRVAKAMYAAHVRWHGDEDEEDAPDA